VIFVPFPVPGASESGWSTARSGLHRYCTPLHFPHQLPTDSDCAPLLDELRLRYVIPVPFLSFRRRPESSLVLFRYDGPEKSQDWAPACAGATKGAKVTKMTEVKTMVRATRTTGVKRKLFRLTKRTQFGWTPDQVRGDERASIFVRGTYPMCPFFRGADRMSAAHSAVKQTQTLVLVQQLAGTTSDEQKPLSNKAISPGPVATVV
jgi:hypothetical protein